MQIAHTWFSAPAWSKKLASSLTIFSLVLLSAGPLLALPRTALAADTGFNSPTVTVSPNEWTGGSNGLSSNDLYATATDDSGSSRDDQGYRNFGFAVPSGSAIDGLEVGVEGFSAVAGSATDKTDSANGAGNYSNWTSSSGTALSAVSASNGAYISEDTNGEAHTFAVANSAIPLGSTINSVTLTVSGRKSSPNGTNPTIALRVENGTGGGQQSDGSSFALTSSSNWNDYSRIMATNPLTGLSWTVDEVNNWTTKFGVVRTNTSDRSARVDHLYVVVNYTPPNTATSCQLSVRVSGDGGSTFSSYKTVTLSGTDAQYTLGGSADAWGLSWTPTNFSNTNFRVEVQGNDQGAPCNDAATYFLDHVQAKVHYTPPIENPPFGQSCGLDMALVLDTSSSISSSELATMKTAVNNFVTALDGTPTEFSLSQFYGTASVAQGFTGDASTIVTAVNGLTSTGHTGTNFEDGLIKGNSTLPNRGGIPNVIVFASDGNPNRKGSNVVATETEAMQAALVQANAIKSQGTRIITLGIGSDVDAQNLKDLSSDDAYYSSASFDSLDETLGAIVTDLCGGTVTVHKLIDADGNVQTTNDRTNGEGWTFTVAGSERTTGANGMTTPVEVDQGSYSVSEQSQNGYSLIGASCTGATNNGSWNENAITGIQVGNQDVVTCTFVNARNSGVLKVVKVVSGNNAPYTDFAFKVDDDLPQNFDSDGEVPVEVSVGAHTVIEAIPDGHPYTVTYQNSLNEDQSCSNLQIAPGATVTCTITNTYVDPGPQCDANAQTVVVSSTETQVNGNDAVVIDGSEIGSGILPGTWVTIPGAEWVWSSDSGDDTTVDKTEVFTQTFTIDGVVTSANLKLSADNGFVVKINGTELDTKLAVEQNYLTVYDYDITSLVQSDNNTIEVTVKNFALGGSTFSNNPAGVIFKATVTADECQDPQPICNPELNLLKNPSFEAPEVAANSWNIFDHGDHGTSGLEWLVSWFGVTDINAPAVAKAEIQHNGLNGWSASHGLQWTEIDSDWDGPSGSLNGEQASVSLSQDVPTIPGKTYQVSYDFKPRPGTAGSESKIDALVNGVVQQTVDDTAGADWSSHTYTFTAVGNTTNVEWRDAAGSPNSLGAFLDNTSVLCQIEPPKSDITICKLDDKQNPLSGWTLLLKGEKVEDLEVPATTVAGTNTAAALTAGKSYIAIANGTWLNDRNPDNHVDAEFSTEDGWVTQMDGFTGYQTDILELQINQAFDPNSNWGPYSATHEYAQSFVPSVNGPANFRIFDGSGTTPDESWYGDNHGSLQVSVYEGYAGVTGENGCVTFTDVPYGSYSVDELLKQNWSNLSGVGPVTVDDASEEFVVVNKDLTPPPTATLIATKVMCEAEQYLPNWGEGGANITAGTAAAWVVQSNGKCWLEPNWKFEWAPSGTGNPNDNIEMANGAWTAFGPTDGTGIISTPIPSGALVWVREQLKSGFIPFSGWLSGNGAATKNDEYSAELYCSTDVLNYDNYDWIDPVLAGETYYCVAFNAPVCEAGEKWASDVEASNQQKRKDGSNVLPERSNPSSALGANDGVFFSLGFGGSLTLAFDTYVENQSGDDLIVYETTNGSYPLEKAAVEVSQDGSAWFPLTEEAVNTAPTGLDFNETGLAWIKFVRLTDTTNSALHTGTADGFDVDAVKALSGVCTEPEDNDGENGGGGGEGSGEFDLSLTKEVSDGTPEDGQQITYTITVTNSGPGTATGVQVTDDLPAGVDYDSYSASQGSYDSVSGVWDIGSLTDDQVVTLTITVTVDAEDDQQILNSALITSGGEDEEGENNSDSALIVVQDEENGSGGGSGSEESSDDEDEDESPFGGANPFSFGPFGGGVLGASTGGGNGQVLGASCGLYMDKFMGLGKKNDVEQVKKLQQFLNKWMGANLPVTGVFGPLTQSAVIAFQQKYLDEILKPWGINAPTGLVYLTTLRWINMLECPDLALQIPTLVPWKD